MTDIQVNFKNHIENEDNSRTLFSGKFGVGKTFFLNNFFKDNENYECIHLFPVNYQISESQNILELLKYDILIELITKGENIFNSLDESDQNLLSFIKDKWSTNSVLKNAIENISSFEKETIGTGIFSTLGKPLKELLKIDKEFHKLKKLNETKLKEFLNKNNSESDVISTIIQSKIKEVSLNKESVLILDDLDRIDPHHLFRILNIFSSHFDERNASNNKFGFNKVIVVGDYENFKSIFHHIYGLKTDESGYFDKFYSTEIYEFNNKTIISEYINEAIPKIKRNNTLDGFFEESGYFKIILEEILLEATNISTKNKLTFRQLITSYKIPENFIIDNRGQFREEGSAITMSINEGIKILTFIFGNKQKLIDTLEDIKNNNAEIGETHNSGIMRFGVIALSKMLNLKDGDRRVRYNKHHFYLLLLEHIKNLA